MCRRAGSGSVDQGRHYMKILETLERQVQSSADSPAEEVQKDAAEDAEFQLLITV